MLHSTKKNLVLLFIILCTSFSLQAQANILVKGQIKNFVYTKDSIRYVFASVLDLATSEKEEKTAAINSNGSFSFALSLQRPQYIEFVYQKLRFSAFARPASTLSIRFDSNQPAPSLQFGGDEALLNNQRQRFKIAFDSFRQKERTGYLKQYEKIEDSPELFKQLAYNDLAASQRFLEEYSKSHNVSAAFKRHALIDLKYSTGYDLLKYGFTHAGVPDSFYSFFKDFPADNAGAAFSGVYLWYLDAYAKYLSSKIGSSVDNYVSYLQRRTTGFLRDVLFSWAMYEFLEANLPEGVEQYLPAYEKVVKNSALKKRIRTLYEAQKNELAMATTSREANLHPTPDNVGKLLFEKIVEKYKGRVVYVDFWGTWCVPCIEEMPNAKKVKEALKGKDIVFLYLAVQSEEPTWKQVIAKLDIQGEHYLLKDDQYKLLETMFQMNGVPHYVLVDKEGKIREKSSLGPGAPELIKKIEALLQ